MCRFGCLLMLAATTGVGCSHKRDCPSPTHRAVAPWPLAIAGRSLRESNEHYAVYSADAESGKELSRRFQHALASLEQRYGISHPGRGLVFAIETGGEHLSVVEDWREKNVDRSRVLLWASEHRGQVFSSATGRPYCLEYTPYFTESFAIPPADAEQLGLWDESRFAPDWICFLSTERRVTESFDRRLQELKQSHAEWVTENVPAEVQALSAPGVALMSLASDFFIYPKWRSIDVELMRLQRREVLWSAIIRAVRENDERPEEVLSKLQDEIDDAWKELWFHRPFD